MKAELCMSPGCNFAVGGDVVVAAGIDESLVYGARCNCATCPSVVFAHIRHRRVTEQPLCFSSLCKYELADGDCPAWMSCLVFQDT